MSLDTTHDEWTDGDLELELELPFVINYQEKGDHLYWQLFLKSDEKGLYNLKKFLTPEDGMWIEKNIIDAMEENDGRV